MLINMSLMVALALSSASPPRASADTSTSSRDESERTDSDAHDLPPTADTPVTPQLVDPDESRFSIAAVPTLTFNTDEGFGTGGVATLYHHEGGVLPYRDALTLKIFISSKLVQNYALVWDGLQPLGLPGRVFASVGYSSTVSQNYCGLGNDVECAEGDADFAARNGGLRAGTTAYDDFVRHYTLMRFIRPYGVVMARGWLRDKPNRVEVLVGWRGAAYIPGDLGARGPFPGSLYAQQFPHGEPGFSSVPFAGIVVDNRDNESFPLHGYVGEASLRGAASFTGSTWTFAGANAQVAGFTALLEKPRVVLASRLVADVLIGAPPTEELARIGGTLDSIAFGGFAIGRGIREHRYIGALKVASQTELRAQLLDVDAFDQHFSFGPAVFADIGWVGKSINDLGPDPLKLLPTVGLSARMLWNENFSVRIDLATSPAEQAGPGFYIIVGQPF
jgi:hypothetical protein